MIEFASEGDMLTVGKLLKNERERQELTFEDIADRTKINVKYVKAIEEDRKSQFPGDLYYELFTKSYAEALGLEYAKIKAGTFASTDSRKDTEGKTSRKEDREARAASKKGGKAKSKPKDKERKSAGKVVAPPGTSVKTTFEPASDRGNSTAETGAEPGSIGKEAGEAETKTGAKPDIVKYLIAMAIVVFCIFIVFIYISISSREPADSEDEHQGEAEDQPTELIQPSEQNNELSIDDEEEGVATLPEDRSSAALDDTFANGPVWMYPESLEVTLTSTQESWATVVADGDTIFTDPFQPDSMNSFKALTELYFSLGNWEFITGSIYGHPFKPMRSFRIAGNEAIRLRITKENWESFIDSSKARYEQD
jgi:transcriptional regulator with XRE-family HTH domain